MDWTERLLGTDPNVRQAVQAPASDGALVIAELHGSGTPQEPYLLVVRAVAPPPANGAPAVPDSDPAPRFPTFKEVYAAADHVAPGCVFMLPPIVSVADRPVTGPHPNLEQENSVELLQTGLELPAGQILNLHNPPPGNGGVVRA